MNNTYSDLVHQTFDFPQEGFEVKDNRLYYHGIDVMTLIEKYGTPFKLTYLPKVGEQISKAKKMFADAMRRHRYKGKYYYCYCTKSSHFSFIVEEAMRHDIHLETSYAYDIEIIKRLHRKNKVSKDIAVVCNGYKTKTYTRAISRLINSGFTNVTPILDNTEEMEDYRKMIKTKAPIKLGFRVAAEEEASFEFYTSRLGIRYRDILPFYVDQFKGNSRFQLKMLHVFQNKGIKDDIHYWSELNRVVNLYCRLKKIAPELNSLNIGGGFPIKHSLGFDYDYTYMVRQIVKTIKSVCKKNNVPVPDIYTEFGSFTVGESGAMIYGILGEKMQNDREKWYMIDSSFITTLPDTWGIGERFLMLPINKWDQDYQQVNLGGLTCDSQDFYTSEEHINQVFLPKREGDNEPLYVGFFNTGAYQDQLSGYGGIKHCLIPAPKHVLIEYDKDGNLQDRLFAKEQSWQGMLNILGY